MSKVADGKIFLVRVNRETWRGVASDSRGFNTSGVGTDRLSVQHQEVNRKFTAGSRTRSPLDGPAVQSGQRDGSKLLGLLGDGVTKPVGC